MRVHLAHPDDPKSAACGYRGSRWLHKPERTLGDCKRCLPARKRLDAARAMRLAAVAGRPLLVLDFDGVFNHLAFAKERSKQRALLGEFAGTFDRACVKRASHIALKAGAVAVVSSSWRGGYSLDGLDALLGGHGFEAQIIGATQDIPGDWTRGLEIGAFLDELPACPAGLAILDDDEIGGALGVYQIRTNFEAGGLTDELAEAALEMLLRPPQPIPWRLVHTGGSL